ncbi:MAG: AbrB/MazE/SpoVT family DNA-binding domain-containing protein [Patescibacteria group bacterium]|nr:AbrB/MazE/SpoVT family DNA-binding domain-containing protein [Patescibacteria group bacterium]
MTRQTKNDFDYCKVEALISVDERGQMVLPKTVRDKAEIKAGDKLAVISFQNRGKNCCLALMKAKDLEETVKNILGPLMEKVTKK